MSRKKKFVPEPRDWVKNPDLYDYKTEPNKLAIDVIEAEVVLKSSLSNLDKLCALNDIVHFYRRNDIYRTFLIDKILTGKVKPKDDYERAQLRQRKEQEKRSKKERELVEKEQRKYQQFSKRQR